MSAVMERPSGVSGSSDEPSRHPWTTADLAALPSLLPSGPVRWELWDGEIRAMSPPGDFHGSVLGRIITIFTVYGEWEGLGRMTGGDAGVVIQAGTPQTTVGVDAAFLTKDQLPAKHSKEGYLLTVPAICAEVRSKNDEAAEVREKVAKYLTAGAQLVWAADERRETVTVYRKDQEPVVLTVEDTLTAEGIIPNLAFPVRRLFEGLE